MVEPLITKIIVDMGRTLGKAVLAGVAVELARVASLHVRKRLGPDDERKKKQQAEDNESVASVKSENEELKAEVQRLRDELAAARKTPFPKESI